MAADPHGQPDSPGGWPDSEAAGLS